MARPLRIQFPGAIYHVTNRGNGRQLIFVDSRDRQEFIGTLAICLKEFGAILHSYCLMGNHYHVILETPRGNLSRIIQRLNSVYSQNFNRRHQKVGHVFQGRFAARLVQKETHLHQASRYVVMNPVHAGLVKFPQDWRWSSYRAIAGYSMVPKWLDKVQTLNLFGAGGNREKILRYRRFVMEKLDSREEKEPLVWATRKFVEKLRKRIRPKELDHKFTRKQRFVSRPTLRELFNGKMSRRKRDETIYRAFKACGYTQAGIAKNADISAARVSRIIKAERARGKV